MALRISCVLVFTLISVALALDNVDNSGLKVVLKVFDECSNSDGFSPCLKKKAITYLDRLSRMDNLALTDDIRVIKDPNDVSTQVSITEEQLEQTLPRSLDERDNALTNMLWDKVVSFVSSRSVEIASPKLSEFGVEEGRKKGGGLGGLGGGGGGGGKKGGGMMMALMMGAMGKMMGLIPLGIAGLFLLAGKALITSKIALLIAGIIAIKKLLAAKQGGGGGGGGHGGGGHQVWAAPSGGGWDKRSLDETHKLAYSSYAPSP